MRICFTLPPQANPVSKLGGGRFQTCVVFASIWDYANEFHIFQGVDITNQSKIVLLHKPSARRKTNTPICWRFSPKFWMCHPQSWLSHSNNLESSANRDVCMISDFRARKTLCQCPQICYFLILFAWFVPMSDSQRPHISALFSKRVLGECHTWRWIHNDIPVSRLVITILQPSCTLDMLYGYLSISLFVQWCIYPF